MSCIRLISLAALVAVAFTGPSARSQEFDEKFEHWPVELRIRGRLVLGSNLSDVSVLRSVLNRSDQDVPVALLLDADVNESVEAQYRSVFGTADSPDEQRLTVAKAGDKLASQVRSMLASNTIFCWHSSRLPDQAQRESLLAARESFRKHMDQGGMIVAIGPVAELFSEYFAVRAPSVTSSVTAPGLNLAPNCVIATEFKGRGADRASLLSILAAKPRTVGVGIGENTAIVLSGRRIVVVGGGPATFMLIADETKPLRVESISARSGGRQRAADVMVDLTEWRRDAIDRTIEPFPPAEPDPPHVEKGTLVIVGGGGMPKGLMEKMVELAGGVEKAKMVYVPCSEQETLPERQRTVESWRRMGVKHATFIHTKDRNKANSDEEFLAPLKDATGIWFGGGRQWNFADSYYGTKAHRLMKEVLKRGGVIGGSSAGASIQARYLARATPIENFRIMAPGYERGGLGFISGVAIDQHFSQRGRQKDMTQLVNRYPQMLGIGIDEATALIVQKSEAQVVGRGKVHFYDRNQPVFPDRPDYIALPAGSTYDLKSRTIVQPARAADKDDGKAAGN